MRYLVMYEQGPSSWGATVPDLNVFAVGDSLEEVQDSIKEAVNFHIEGLKERNEPIPEPSIVRTEFVEVA